MNLLKLGVGVWQQIILNYDKKLLNVTFRAPIKDLTLTISPDGSIPAGNKFFFTCFMYRAGPKYFFLETHQHKILISLDYFIDEIHI